MRKTSKLKSKLCAWLLVCATVFTTLASSGASVLADNNDTETKQNKTQVSTLSVKSGEGGEISVELPDGQIETTSDSEELELELETGSTVEATVSLAEGYEVSTYRLITDSGDEEDIDEYDSFSFEITEDTDLEATYTEEEAEKAPVVEEPEEVVTEETEENEEAVSETPQPTNPTPSEEETTTEEPQSTDTVGKEDEIATSKADVTSMSDITKEVEKDSDIAKDSILDPVTEQYVLENANAKYTSADKIELANILIVKNSLSDSKYITDDTTIDSLMYGEHWADAFLGMISTSVAVYNLDDNSDYLVAFANTMMNDKNTEAVDAVFAITDNTGTVLSDCIYDYSTGLAYINKKHLMNEEGESLLANVQLQLLQSQSSDLEDIESTVLSTTQEDEDISTNYVSESPYINETTVKTKKNLDEDEMIVSVNGVVVNDDSYSYNSSKGEVTIKQSSSGINTVNIEAEEETLVSKIKDKFAPLTAKAAANPDYIETWGEVDLADNVGVGYYTRGTGFYWYGPSTVWYFSYGYSDLQSMANLIYWGGGVDWSAVNAQGTNNLNIIVNLKLSSFTGIDFPDDNLRNDITMQCGHISNPLGTAGNVAVGGKPANVDTAIRVLHWGVDPATGREYVILGFLTQTTHNQAGTGFYKFYVKPRSGDLTLKKVSANTSLTSGNGNYSNNI